MQPPQAGPPGAPGAVERAQRVGSHDRERTGGSRGGTRRSRRSRKPRRQPEQRMHRRRASPKRARGASQERRAKGGGYDSLSPLLTASQSDFHGVGRVIPLPTPSETLSEAKFREISLLTSVQHRKYTLIVYNITKEGNTLVKKREWKRETYDSVNTGFRIPKELYWRFEQHQARTFMNKTEIMIAALEAYLPHYEKILEEGGSEE